MAPASFCCRLRSAVTVGLRFLATGAESTNFGLIRDETTASANISKAAALYLERVNAHKKLIAAKQEEFETGKRHLANMMGMDADSLTQEDIENAIAYLLPSGLFEPKARPKMLPPEQVFARNKEAQFDSSGRPYHTFFYTGRPNYFQTLHDIATHFNDLNAHEDKMRLRVGAVEVLEKIDFAASEWKNKKEVEAMFLESLTNNHYNDLVRYLTLLSKHDYANRCKDFLMKFRKEVESVTTHFVPPQVQLDELGRRFSMAEGVRKTAKALVKLYDNGSGYFNINGLNIHYFKFTQDREQVIMPLQVSGLLGKVDVVAHVIDGGYSGQSQALRLALATAATSYLDEDGIDRLRLDLECTQD